MMKSLGLYVHIPYCLKKCKYCDFVSYANVSREEKLQYVEKLCSEIKSKGSCCKASYYVDTIFFGGGTPTCLEAEDLIRILNCIEDNFTLCCENVIEGEARPKNCDGLEITFEANPETLTIDKMEKLKAAGFNRVSIGVQSFEDKILNILGRVHSSARAEEAVKMAKALGFNTNLDLMFGVPGQSLKGWQNTIEKAISLNPEHISFYSLQLEEGTSLYNEYRFGDLDLPSWEENRKMYHMALDMLKSAGYLHYEISNAAKIGFECRHNLKYWSLKDYLGIGEAAHSFIEGRRTGEENPDLKGDFIFTRLRLINGFKKSEYKNLFGIEFEEEFGNVYKELLTDDMLTEDNGFIRFTEKGLDYTNPVMGKLINKLEYVYDK